MDQIFRLFRQDHPTVPLVPSTLLGALLPLTAVQEDLMMTDSGLLSWGGEGPDFHISAGKWSPGQASIHINVLELQVIHLSLV